MSSPSPSKRDYPQPCEPRPERSETHRSEHWIARATWAFVALGILLRIARYLMNYPLWWDEAFVAVNFIRRDYLDLLRPLDYGQVCPILFLWCELAVVKLLGFSEWSLRLFPLVCATASVVLFRHVTARIVRGVPLLLAVAIFATSFHPIIHAADVKPYASDLLAALMLLAIAVEWSRAPNGPAGCGPWRRWHRSRWHFRTRDLHRRRERDRACSRGREEQGGAESGSPTRHLP